MWVEDSRGIHDMMGERSEENGAGDANLLTP
jgi:hypothetical protein